MPPVDPTVGLTPWWVRFFIRVVEIVTTTNRFDKLSDKDRTAFTDNLNKLNNYLTFRGK